MNLFRGVFLISLFVIKEYWNKKQDMGTIIDFWR